MNVKKVDIITAAEEDMLWEMGFLGDDTPAKLLDTLVFTFGIHFALRAAQDHRNMRWDKLSLRTDENDRPYLQYTEDYAKNHQGGIQHKNVKPKVVRAYANDAYPDRCIIRLYQSYLFHCPPPEERPRNAFYLRPLQRIKSNVCLVCGTQRV